MHSSALRRLWAEPLKQPEEGKRRAEEGRWGGSSAVRYQCLFMYLFLCFQAGLPCPPWVPAVSAEPWARPEGAVRPCERPGPGLCADGPAAVFTLALCSGSFALCPQRGSCLVQPWQPTGLATVGGKAQPDPALAPCLPGASSLGSLARAPAFLCVPHRQHLLLHSHSSLGLTRWFALFCFTA